MEIFITKILQRAGHVITCILKVWLPHFRVGQILCCSSNNSNATVVPFVAIVPIVYLALMTKTQNCRGPSPDRSVVFPIQDVTSQEFCARRPAIIKRHIVSYTRYWVVIHPGLDHGTKSQSTRYCRRMMDRPHAERSARATNK